MFLDFHITSPCFTEKVFLVSRVSSFVLDWIHSCYWLGSLLSSVPYCYPQFITQFITNFFFYTGFSSGNKYIKVFHISNVNKVTKTHSQAVSAKLTPHISSLLKFLKDCFKLLSSFLNHPLKCFFMVSSTFYWNYCFRGHQ